MLITLHHKLYDPTPELAATRDGFGSGVVQAGEQDANVVLLCCDLTDSTKSDAFKKKFPQRFFEVGVAEQNMAGIAAGLALSGKVPFITSYAVFSPGRNWDQLRVSVCYSGANVKIMGAHAGISVGPDGTTHQALEDIAITRVLPGMTVLVPCDMEETRKAVLTAAIHKGPVYIRFGREKVPVITVPETPFEIGKAQLFREGTDVAIIACGSMVYHSLIAAEQLKSKGISVAVVNAVSVKPLDEETITAIAKQCGVVVTAEEHQITGGLGGVVAECMGRNYPVPIEFVGMPNSFGESGKPSELIAKYGMDTKAVISAVERVLRRKG